MPSGGWFCPSPAPARGGRCCTQHRTLPSAVGPPLPGPRRSPSLRAILPETGSLLSPQRRFWLLPGLAWGRDQASLPPGQRRAGSHLPETMWGSPPVSGEVHLHAWGRGDLWGIWVARVEDAAPAGELLMAGWSWSWQSPTANALVEDGLVAGWLELLGSQGPSEHPPNRRAVLSAGTGLLPSGGHAGLCQPPPRAGSSRPFLCALAPPQAGWLAWGQKVGSQ